MEADPAEHSTYPPPPGKEPYWPAPLTVALAIGLQLLFPSPVTAGPTWLMPSVEGVLLLGLAVATPGDPLHISHLAVIGLTALVTTANAVSLGLLIHALLNHQDTSNSHALIAGGALIWATNVLTFGLFYWELDRGGRDVRAAGRDRLPDFLFPQMSADGLVPPGWRPEFVDYLYLSFTNSTAFSPTDTMPVSRRAKAVMTVQSLVALLTAGVVIARAVNVLR